MLRLVVFMVTFLIFDTCFIVSANLFDIRTVSYDELSKNIQLYQSNNDLFDAVAIDLQKNQIIVGAKNAIIRLSLDNFHLLEKFTWESSMNDKTICHSHIPTHNECENYVRVLALRSSDQSLLTCGTNSYHPICVWRRSDSLSTIIHGEKAILGIPSSYVLIETGELYSATVNEPIFGAHDPLIQRSFSGTKQLRTQQHDSNWLKNPHFVRILNIGQYVYTFFREVSLEHLSCGTHIYSRVARVCKHDDGAMKFSDTFRSYSKVRLSCSKKLFGDTTSFDFNELQSIYFYSSLNLIYAAFNLPKSGLSGSAVCIYTVDQLESVFQSSFLTQKSNESYWLPIPVEQDVEKCEPSSSNEISSVTAGRVLRSGVLQSSLDPLVFDDIRIGHLLVDYFYDVTVLFVITVDGLSLRKYSLIVSQNHDRKLCLIEKIDLKPAIISLHDWKVNQAELIVEKREIILTTSKYVLKLSVARCHRFNTSHLCFAIMDPYCTWDEHHQQCVFSTTVHRKNARSFRHCPLSNITIGDGWTAWSPWLICQQETGEKCQCRTRSCSDSKHCEGNHVEISRCEVHGGWSSWSIWSSCPLICGKAYRTRIRTRTCTNPKPKHNGRICIGPEREEEPCPEIICSNETSPLSVWSEWSSCSKSCGIGIQKRKRTCVNTIEKCDECIDDTRLCNELPCPVQSVTLWSNWTRIVPVDRFDNDDTITETRTRFVCSISASLNEQSLEMNSDKVIYRVCNHKGSDCQQTDSDSHDNWSSWSHWSECYPSCNVSGSTQTRHRTCLNKQCFGSDIDKRDCVSCLSKQRSDWSCWSDWSECSLCTSMRPYSRKLRTRTCLTNSCEGSSYEDRSCFCPSLLRSMQESRFTLLHLFLASLISFFFSCVLILVIYVLCCHFHRRNENFHHKEDFQGSASNSSSSPHTAMDSDTFTTLSNANIHPTKFRSFDLSFTPIPASNNYLNGIPSKKLNVYINSKEVSSLPPLATLKRTSLMSSMKTNLDADDI